jgi:hypothetical protein
MKKAKIVIHDGDLAKVGAALRRAAKRARKIAAVTNTPFIIYENGRVIRKRIKEKTRNSRPRFKAQS